MNDHDDIHRLLRGSRSDVAAFEALYRQMAPGLLRWIRARVPDAEVAHDLLAETFAQVICSADRYRGDCDATAGGWVWAIARNLLHRYYRRQKVEVAARRRLDMHTATTARPAEFTEVDAAVGERLGVALDELPVTIRASVWLRVVDELSYDEIATRLGCSTTAARQRVARGMRRLSIAMGGTR